MRQLLLLGDQWKDNTILLKFTVHAINLYGGTARSVAGLTRYLDSTVTYVSVGGVPGVLA